MPRTPARLDQLLVETSRTFALTIPLLPEPTRGEVTAAYLLFRIADTLEDANLWSGDKKGAELERLGNLLRQPAHDRATELARSWTSNPPCDHPGYLELLSELATVLEFTATLSPPAQRSISTHIGRTIERMSTFVDQQRGAVLQLEDLEALRSYCYAVAGIVGEMLTELFLLDWTDLVPVAGELTERAASFGEALQLVNILKDSATDSREGRNFLPPGVDRAEVFRLARADLGSAGRYCLTLHDAGAPRGLVEFTTLPVLLAGATLDRVEGQGPGAKLTRPEVAAIIHQMKQALDRGRAAELWSSFRGAK